MPPPETSAPTEKIPRLSPAGLYAANRIKFGLAKERLHTCFPSNSGNCRHRATCDLRRTGTLVLGENARRGAQEFMRGVWHFYTLAPSPTPAPPLAPPRR